MNRENIFPQIEIKLEGSEEIVKITREQIVACVESEDITFYNLIYAVSQILGEEKRARVVNIKIINGEGEDECVNFRNLDAMNTQASQGVEAMNSEPFDF